MGDSQRRLRWEELLLGCGWFKAVFFDTKRVLKAVNETINTAMHASNCCQKLAHISKSLACTRDMRMIAMTIMKTLRQRKEPMPSFWRLLILTFHKRYGGMARTRGVNAGITLLSADLLMRSVMMSRDIVTASTANVLVTLYGSSHFTADELVSYRTKVGSYDERTHNLDCQTLGKI